ncbi:hypothetical protein LshimejAT787_0700080 [Lyophyllum shimeji]|uniref:Uncharacterized protein n=1 Tax=Lyophyllum shimeji TaxID=47721 RepID=A0A9P3PQ25_LYOSH|nr:hypothetical protein LshimejAT787_0700080 [Lyophyllum shimeji]
MLRGAPRIESETALTWNDKPNIVPSKLSARRPSNETTALFACLCTSPSLLPSLQNNVPHPLQPLSVTGALAPVARHTVRPSPESTIPLQHYATWKYLTLPPAFGRPAAVPSEAQHAAQLVIRLRLATPRHPTPQEEACHATLGPTRTLTGSRSWTSMLQVRNGSAVPPASSVCRTAID